MLTLGIARKVFRANQAGSARLCYRQWASTNTARQPGGKYGIGPPAAQPQRSKPRHVSRANQVSKKDNIGFVHELKMLPGQDLNYCVYLAACNRHTWNPYIMKYLDFEYETPFTDMVIAKTLARHPEPLWFYAKRVTHDNLKAVVVKKATGKAHRAFRVALKANGYDHIGRKKVAEAPDGEVTGHGTRSKGIQELYGTVTIMMRPLQLIHTPFREVAERLTGIVAGRLEAAIGRRTPPASRKAA